MVRISLVIESIIDLQEREVHKEKNDNDDVRKVHIHLA